MACKYRSIIYVLAAAMLAACSGNGGNGATPTAMTPGVSQDVGRVAGRPLSSSDPVMYVANGAYRAGGSVTVLDTISGKVLRNITSGVNFPYALTVDTNGNVYVANRKGKSNVTVYAPDTSAPALTITQNIVKPIDLKFDPAAELNVLNVSDVTVYAPGSGTLLRQVKNKLTLCLAMAFDTAGDLFVSNLNEKTKQTYIVEYAPGSTKVLRTFGGSQFTYANHLVMGADGYLYVGTETTVVVLDPNTGSIVRTITSGVTDLVAMAFDGAGNLYVANSPGVPNNGIISVYAPEASTPSYQIEQEGLYSNVLLFDQKNNLYVVSSGGILEFAPGKTAPKRTIDQGTAYPWAAAFGP
jgi:hypothetical protein